VLLREGGVADLLPRPPRHLAREHHPAGVDEPAQLLPAVEIVQQLPIVQHGRTAGRASGKTRRLLELITCLHAHIVTPATDTP
jgi:hypothetical protein